jgi:hypothetical protein
MNDSTAGRPRMPIAGLTCYFLWQFLSLWNSCRAEDRPVFPIAFVVTIEQGRIGVEVLIFALIFRNSLHNVLAVRIWTDIVGFQADSPQNLFFTQQRFLYITNVTAGTADAF